MEQTTTTTASAEAGKRPTFLTVLCILSFIAAGLGIFGYITVLTVMGAASAVASNMQSMGGEAGAASAALSEAMASAGPSAGLTWAYIIIGFVTTLVALYGVIKMWKLQKVGFFIYVGAMVVSTIMGIVYSGMGASMVGILFTVLFIVLYGLNLKHLK
jgi:hypothetical protein